MHICLWTPEIESSRQRKAIESLVILKHMDIHFLAALETNLSHGTIKLLWVLQVLNIWN